MGIKGSCECQGVVFELIGELRAVVFCHCSQCRKTSGHYWAATQVSKGNLNLIKATSLSWYDSSDKARRGFAVYVALACFMREKVLIKSLFQQARWKYRHLLIGCVISTLQVKVTIMIFQMIYHNSKNIDPSIVLDRPYP